MVRKSRRKEGEGVSYRRQENLEKKTKEGHRRREKRKVRERLEMFRLKGCDRWMMKSWKGD